MLALAFALTTGACKGVSTPTGGDVEAGAGVASGICTLIDGIDDSGVVRTICATVAEVALIVEFILTLRTTDGGTPDASTSCKPLPGSTLCATAAERAKGILYVTHQRAAHLMLDGGGIK
jgi:hypothetical protein